MHSLDIYYFTKIKMKIKIEMYCLSNLFDESRKWSKL